jgi:predicted DNA-binding transcriptional regulator YafY
MQTTEDIIRAAIAAGQSVEFIYMKENKKMSVRYINPAEINKAANGKITVIGYDLGRRGLRKFRMDRIHGEPVVFSRPPKGYDSTQYEPEEVS